MKRDILQNQYKSKGLFGTLIADIVCFLVVIALSVGFCYSYFSDKVNVMGNATTATIAIAYQDGSGAKLTDITGQINGGSAATLNGKRIAPGDTITITGNAVSIGKDGTSATASSDSYVLAQLDVIGLDTAEITGKDDTYIKEHTIDKETIWYNIADGKIVYAERGLFQIGASVLAAKGTQALSISYTFEGDKYNEQYLGVKLVLTLHTHQKDFLNLAEDYNNYSAVGTYAKESIYATHCITGRKRDVWEDSDAIITGLTLSDLETDESGAYLINSCKDWMIMRATATTDYHQGKTFKLNSYLDFNNNTTDKTIGQFNGAFDGQGYTISNLYMVGTNKNGYGLFNSIKINDQASAPSTYIINLGLDGARMSATNSRYCGMLVGVFRGGVVESCFVVGTSWYDNSVVWDISVTGATSHEISVGGIIGFGYVEYQSDVVTEWVRNNYVCCNVYVNNETDTTSNSGSERVAGVVGSFYPKSSVFENNYFNGNISHVDESDSPTTALIIASSQTYATISNSFAISDNFSTNATIGNKAVNVAQGYCYNVAYTDNTGLTSASANYNKVLQTGNNQTAKTLTIDTFKSVGLMRDAFGWDTNVWATDIYGEAGYVVLRVFYNY